MLLNKTKKQKAKNTRLKFCSYCDKLFQSTAILSGKAVCPKCAKKNRANGVKSRVRIIRLKQSMGIISCGLNSNIHLKRILKDKGVNINERGMKNGRDTTD
jgi:uncharacterized paraquat-inducible protein A